MDSKHLVADWFARGRPPSMVTDDFRWILGPPGAQRIRVGPSGISGVLGVAPSVYQGGVVDRNTHFFIAEDDVVAWQVDTKATLLNGEPYHSDYIFTIRVRDGKIAEVWEMHDPIPDGLDRPSASREVPESFVMSDDEAAVVNSDPHAADTGYFDEHPPRY